MGSPPSDQISAPAPVGPPRIWEWIPIFAIFIVPLAFIPYPGDPEFSAVKIWLIEAGAALGLGAWIRFGESLPTRLSLFLLVFLALCTISLVPAVNRFLALSHLGLLSALLVFSFLGSQLSREGSLRLLRAAILSSVMVSLLGIAQSAGILLSPRPDVWGELMYPSTFRHTNYAAQFLAPVIPLTLGLLITARTRPVRLLLGGAGICETVYLFITSSRAGAISAAAGVLLFLGLRLSLRERSGCSRFIPTRSFIAPLVAAMVVSAGLLLFPPARKGLFHLGTIFDPRHPSTRVRILLAHDTGKMILARPLAGVGLGNYSVILPEYWSNELRDLIISGTARTAENAHNDYLSLAAEAGLPALAVFLALVGAVLRSAGKTTRREPDDLRAAALASFCTLCLYSLMDYPLRNPGSALLFWILLGVNGRKPVPLFSNLFERFRPSRVSSTIAHTTLALMVLALLWISTRPLIANYYWHRGLSAYVKSPLSAEGYLSRTLEYSPHHHKTLFLLGNIAALKNDIPRAVRLYEQCIRLVPADSRSWFNLAELLLEQNQLAEADRAVEKVLQLDPRHPGANYRRAIFLALQGKTFSSAHYLKKAISLDSRFLSLARSEPIFSRLQNRWEYRDILSPHPPPADP